MTNRARVCSYGTDDLMWVVPSHERSHRMRRSADLTPLARGFAGTGSCWDRGRIAMPAVPAIGAYPMPAWTNASHTKGTTPRPLDPQGALTG